MSSRKNEITDKELYTMQNRKKLLTVFVIILFFIAALSEQGLLGILWYITVAIYLIYAIRLNKLRNKFIGSIQLKLSNKDIELHNKDIHISHLEKIKEVYEQQIYSLEHSNNQLKTHESLYKNSVKKLNTNKDTLNKQVEGLITENDKLKRQYDELKTHYSELLQHAAELLEFYNKHKNQNDELKRQNNKLNRQYDELSQQIEGFIIENDELKRQSGELKRQNDRLSQQAAELSDFYNEHKIEKPEPKTTDDIKHNSIEDTSSIPEDDGRKIYESKVKNIYFGVLNKEDNNENN